MQCARSQPSIATVMWSIIHLRCRKCRYNTSEAFVQASGGVHDSGVRGVQRTPRSLRTSKASFGLVGGGMLFQVDAIVQHF